MSQEQQTEAEYDSRDAALALKDAESPDEVEEVLLDTFFNNAQWKALGETENNYGIVENQAGAPIPALVELLVNSYDAHFMRGFHELAGTTDPNPEEDDLPKFRNQEEAKQELLDDDDMFVTLRADGSKPTDEDIINFTVIDNGCGQSHSDFEKTFLGLLDPGKYKQQYPFLQGQYGMGSAAVLQFAGGQSFKFICSAAASGEGEWSWSLVRQNKSRDRYEYLTINGNIPTFNGTIESQPYGTFIKIYDYQMSVSKTTIAGDRRFQKRLERYLVDPPFQLQLRDKRYASVSKKSTGGLRSRINAFDELIDEQFTITYNFDDDRLGIRDIDIFIFKRKTEIEKLKEEGETSKHRDRNRFVGGADHREMAVLYTVNGQTHGSEGRSFLTNRCNKPRVGGSTLAIVDCSDMAGTDMVDLFQPTRDRIKQKSIGNELREGVKDAIETDESLNEKEERRRQELASDESDEILNNSLENIVENDPGLQQFFDSGEKATTDLPSEDDETDYTPPEVPDTFNIISNYSYDGDHEFHVEDEDGTYSIEVPVNRNPQSRFYLNAPNGYLSDDGDGELYLDPTEEAVKWSNLNSGILTVGLRAPDTYRPGDVITLIFRVTRPRDEPLSQRIQIEFTEKEEIEKPKSNDDSETTSKPEGSAGLAFPNPHRVTREDWADHDFDEHDIVRIASTGNSVSDMDIYINMDAAAIKRFLSNNNLRASGKEFVQERYVIAVALYSVAMYIEFEQQYNDGEFINHMTPEELVSSSMRGLGQVMLHSIAPEQLLSEY